LGFLLKISGFFETFEKRVKQLRILLSFYRSFEAFEKTGKE